VDAVNVAAVVWDMDGTLFDSSSVVPGAFIAALRTSGTANVSAEQVIAAYGLGPPAVLLAHFLGRQATDAEVDRYHRELEGAARATAVYPGVPQALDALRPRLRLAVFTGASRRAANILLGATGLSHYFDEVVGGDEVARAKPAPDGLLETCRRLAILPEEAAYVGDAPVDLEAAREAGVMAIGAAWGHMYSADATADAVAQSPGDVESLVRRAVVD
jgi:HAD superfamily hydrolase (TIGR01549 family)